MPPYCKPYQRACGVVLVKAVAIWSVPGKGWNTLLRLYGPLQPWFDKTWRPGEIEPVE